MKHTLSLLALCLCLTASAQSLVLLHTNDTHSNIESDANGVGGILPRKAIIDSVRQAEKNVMLIDAGDIVQGTLYFNYFNGDVEYPIFNMMDYDVRILGNHEFDNGLDEIARLYRGVKGARLSANYDFSDTPARGLFEPYVIKKVGKKKVGFMGINIDPTSLISEENYKGLKWSDPVKVANETAAMLRKKGCDLVVAVTHIGYERENDKPTDVDLARQSKDIDIIIGGHSHTVVDPKHPEKFPCWIPNAVGRDVLVAQTGKYGRNLGYIKLDLSDFAERKIDYQLIPVTDRFPAESYDKQIQEFLVPYRHVVDSVNNHPIGYSLTDMPNGRRTGAYANWAADFAAQYGRQIIDSLRRAGNDVPDLAFALMNVGGIRQAMPKGIVTEGQILSTFPFSNSLRLIELKGSDIIETMQIVAKKGGEAVSRELLVLTDDDNNMAKVLINGKPVDPEKRYVVCTIDYVAQGNDDMVPMKRHTEIWRDDQLVKTRIMQYIKDLTSQGIPITSDESSRFVPMVKL